MSHHLSRRAFATALALAPIAFATQPAMAQEADYPNRPVKVVVPFVPGGNADTTARIFAEAYSAQLGQPFVVENRGGAGGMIGASQVVRAKPDGYTVLIGTTGPIIASWQLAGKAATYTLEDMKPIALLTFVPGVLVVNASSPIKTYGDLVDHARSGRGSFTFGHPGNATAGHVNILQLQKAIGAQFVAVAYKGAGPAVQDLMGGQLDAVATDLPSALQLVKGGRLRALGIVFPQRVASLPDVPTMAELKQPEVDIAPFTALMAPRDVSALVVERLAETNRTVLADAAVRRRIEDVGGIPASMSRPEFEKFLERQVRTYGDLIASGLLKTQ